MFGRGKALDELRRQRDAALEGGDFEAVRRLSQELVEKGQQKLVFDDWFVYGRACFEQDEHAEAVKAYEQALRLDPENSQAMTNKAISTFLGPGRVGAKEAIATEQLVKVLRKHPEVGPAWFYVGLNFWQWILWKAGNIDDCMVIAMNAFMRVEELMPQEAYRLAVPFTDGQLLTVAEVLQHRGRIDRESDETLFDAIAYSMSNTLF